MPSKVVVTSSADGPIAYSRRNSEVVNLAATTHVSVSYTWSVGRRKMIGDQLGKVWKSRGSDGHSSFSNRRTRTTPVLLRSRKACFAGQRKRAARAHHLLDGAANLPSQCVKRSIFDNAFSCPAGEVPPTLFVPANTNLTITNAHSSLSQLPTAPATFPVYVYGSPQNKF